MIIGKGDIASAITDKENVTFFASGISNSACEDENQFARERDLLLAQKKNMHLVYFSSLGIYYNPNTMYMLHKKRMEALVKENFMCYTIFRIGNILWGNNQTTLINALKNKIRNKENFVVKDDHRYLLTKTGFMTALKKVKIGNKEIIPLTGRMLKVSEIVDEIIEGKL